MTKESSQVLNIYKMSQQVQQPQNFDANMGNTAPKRRSGDTILKDLGINVDNYSEEQIAALKFLKDYKNIQELGMSNPDLYAEKVVDLMNSYKSMDIKTKQEIKKKVTESPSRFSYIEKEDLDIISGKQPTMKEMSSTMKGMMNTKTKDQAVSEAYKFIRSLGKFDSMPFPDSKDGSPEMTRYENQYGSLFDEYNALDVRGKRAVYDILSKNNTGKRMLKEYSSLIKYQR